jgi:hypothetical protein
MALDLSEVDSSIVIVGGVTAANLPHFLRNSRLSFSSRLISFSPLKASQLEQCRCLVITEHHAITAYDQMPGALLNLVES